MTTCPECHGKVIKVGPPVRKGWFVDQLINCPNCPWCGVETEISPPPTVYQPSLFDAPE